MIVKTQMRIFWFGACVCLALVSCQKKSHMVVESAYQEPLLAPLKYNFLRDGVSSVDILEAKFLGEPIQQIYSTLLRNALISSCTRYKEVLRLLNEGVDYGYGKPDQKLSRSFLHQAQREKVLGFLTSLFDSTAVLGGCSCPTSSSCTTCVSGSTCPKSGSTTRWKDSVAKKGRAGYVGVRTGGPNTFYVDARGLAPAEIFSEVMNGAVYLDQILNHHLNNRFLHDAELRRQHEQLQIIAGKNYTALEHHWDLAYGYYVNFWQPLAQGDGLAELQGADSTIFNAFVLGRMALGKARYLEVDEHVRVIRRELSRVVALRVLDGLLGPAIQANLREDPRAAFLQLSRVYGMVYALPFARSPKGTPYVTRVQVDSMLAQFIQKDGLWDASRLFANIKTKGSVQWLADQVSTRFATPFPH